MTPFYSEFIFNLVLYLGSASRIHLSEVTRDRLEKPGGYHLEPRGGIEIKGKGLMNTYWLLGKKGFDKELPIPPSIGFVINTSGILIIFFPLTKTQLKK